MLFRVYLLGMIQQTEYIETCSHKSYRKKNPKKKKKKLISDAGCFFVRLQTLKHQMEKKNHI